MSLRKRTRAGPGKPALTHLTRFDTPPQRLDWGPSLNAVRSPMDPERGGFGPGHYYESPEAAFGPCGPR
jgi:hypothetical protein